MILRLHKHLTGTWSAILLDWNTDKELLFPRQVFKNTFIVKRFNVTVMSWNSRYKITQHEVAGQSEATQEVDSNDHDLKFSKSINFIKHILELHCFFQLLAVCLLLTWATKANFLLFLHFYTNNRLQFWVDAQAS